MGNFSKFMGALGYKMLYNDAQGDAEQSIKQKKGVRRSSVRKTGNKSRKEAFAEVTLSLRGGRESSMGRSGELSRNLSFS